MSASGAAEFVEGDCIVNVHPDSRLVLDLLKQSGRPPIETRPPAAALEMRSASDGVK
jgi:hypothetical protein